MECTRIWLEEGSPLCRLAPWLQANSTWLGQGASENVLQTRSQWQPVGVMRGCVRAWSLCCVWLFSTPMTPRLLCPWDFPGKNAREGSYFLLWEIFPTQGLNSHLLHWQVDSSPLSHLGSHLVSWTLNNHHSDCVFLCNSMSSFLGMVGKLKQ